jgi:hypothetical protein
MMSTFSMDKFEAFDFKAVPTGQIRTHIIQKIYCDDINLITVGLTSS